VNSSKGRRFAIRCVVVLAAAVVLIAAAHYPYDVDRLLSPEELAKNRQYYAEAYQKGVPAEEQAPSAYDSKYLKMATEAAEDAHIDKQVSDFAATYGLRNGAVLDIGSGRGYLQDVVENYTGLDISSNVGRFYHKKFVLGSATAMPFPDNSFDGGWSIWVLEHVPNPEQALVELRRVMKNNAVFFMVTSWNCTSWAAEGYSERPYSDFDWKGKLIKASIPVRASRAFKSIQRVPNRLVRDAASWSGAFWGGPTRLHYRLLQPNYKEYWEPDSDALNDIDRNEMMLWFRSRGDECLNCGGIAGSPLMGYSALIIRIHK